MDNQAQVYWPIAGDYSVCKLLTSSKFGHVHVFTLTPLHVAVVKFQICREFYFPVLLLVQVHFFFQWPLVSTPTNQCMQLHPLGTGDIMELGKCIAQSNFMSFFSNSQYLEIKITLPEGVHLWRCCFCKSGNQGKSRSPTTMYPWSCCSSRSGKHQGTLKGNSEVSVLVISGMQQNSKDLVSELLGRQINYFLTHILREMELLF